MVRPQWGWKTALSVFCFFGVYTFIFIDLEINLKEVFFKSGLKSKFSLNFKNVNYETRNVEQYKKDTRHG